MTALLIRKKGAKTCVMVWSSLIGKIVVRPPQQRQCLDQPLMPGGRLSILPIVTQFIAAIFVNSWHIADGSPFRATEMGERSLKLFPV
ncbi:hypothetical protein [Sphingomonas sp. 28-62-20]|uniref:hypothetical protein n=1 Tax=Sphingomonas sp. 28-62-20 TaxID=1970433 RepID=UPI0035A96BBC